MSTIGVNLNVRVAVDAEYFEDWIVERYASLEQHLIDEFELILDNAVNEQSKVDVPFSAYIEKTIETKED